LPLARAASDYTRQAPFLRRDASRAR